MKKLYAISVSLLLAHIFMFPFHPMCSFDFATSYGRFFEDAKLRDVGTAGYPIFVALWSLIFDPVIAGQFASAVFASLLVFPVYFILRKWLNENQSLIGVLIVSLNPLIFRYAMITMSDMTGLFFFALACWMYLDERYCECALAVGFGYITRPELILLSPLFAMGFARKRLIIGIVFFATTLAMFGLYSLYVSIDRGSFMLTNKQSMLPDVSNYFLNLFKHSENILKYAGIPALALGLWGMTKNPKHGIISIVFLLILPLYPMLLIHGRYVIIPVFCLLLYAIYALNQTKWGMIAIIAIFIGYLPTYSEVTKPDEDLMWLMEYGKALKPYVEPNDRFLDRKPYLPFYAGGIYYQIPNTSPDSIIRYAVENNCKWIVINGLTLAYFMPQLRSVAHLDTLRWRDIRYTRFMESSEIKVWKRQ